jgi:hypothetical protein
VGLAIYFVALAVFSHVTGGLERQAVEISQTYTNSLQLKEMLGVLQQRELLKFGALDCWEAVAETTPTGFQLETLNFNDGRTLRLSGTAPTDQASEITTFFDNLRKWRKGNQPMFDTTMSDNYNSHLIPNVGVGWTFELELKQQPGEK